MQPTSRAEKEKYWRHQMSMAEKFPGSIPSYCKSQGLSVATFFYWRKKFKNQPQPMTLEKSPFVEVEVSRDQVRKTKCSMPSAAWVAELILHLQMGARQ